MLLVLLSLPVVVAAAVVAAVVVAAVVVAAVVVAVVISLYLLFVSLDLNLLCNDVLYCRCVILYSK